MFVPQVGSFALSEAGSGSDAFALEANAKKDGDYWVLNGEKLWITNSGEAGIWLVFANILPSDSKEPVSVHNIIYIHVIFASLGLIQMCFSSQN